MNKLTIIPIVLPMMFLIQGAMAHSSGDSHNHGLGTYGATGPISRAQLPAGISERVTDQAIALAQSKEMAQARSNWNGKTDFVWQVHYQLKFRSKMDYLSTEPKHLANVLTTQRDNMGIEALGLYMTDAEAREFERRQKLGDRISEVRALIGAAEPAREGEAPAYDSNYAGIWQDQMDGGAIVVALVDPTLANKYQLQKAVGGEKNIRIIDVNYSWNEVQSYRDALLETFKAYGVPAAARINSTGKGRIIEVVSPNAAEARKLALRVAPADLLKITKGETDSPQGGPTDTHAEADQQPGLQIEFDPGSNCTWGINGHTSSRNYLVTAGHCGGSEYQDFNGWTDGLEIHQNNAFHLTPNSQYLFSINTEPYDMKMMSTPQADSNCYHGNGHCNRNITWRALHNSWEVGSDMVCASMGTSNVYECGTVLELNYSSTSGGCEGSRWVRYDIDTSGGDSGSGIVGPVAVPDLSIDAIHACGAGTSGFGNTSFDVKTQFNTRVDFDFNCASTPVRGRAGSAWSACPTRNR